MVMGMTSQPKRAGGCFPMAMLVFLLLSLAANGVLLLIVTVQAAGSGGVSTAERAVRFQEVEIVPGTDRERRIAVVALNGMIAFGQTGTSGRSMVTEFRAALQRSMRDETVSGILILVNSGGGEVTASDELYAAVKAAAEKKPVLVYLMAVGASGAYYTALGANEIMAAESCFTGSIGVILRTLNYEQLMEKVGVRTLTFKSGAWKDMLSGDREPTEEEKAFVEGMIMQLYGKFVGLVATERGLSEEALRNGVADGRVLSGTDALEAGLIDRTGRLEDAYERVREMAGVPDAPLVQLAAMPGLGNLLRWLNRAEGATVEVRLPGVGVVGELESGYFYYLPALVQ